MVVCTIFPKSEKPKTPKSFNDSFSRTLRAKEAAWPNPRFWVKICGPIVSRKTSIAIPQKIKVGQFSKVQKR